MNSPLTDLLARDLGDVDEQPDAHVELTLEISDDGEDDVREASDEKSAVAQALLESARLAAVHTVGLDEFMKTAWQAYLEAHPELHEKIERQALLKHLKLLRRTGKIGLA